MLAISAETFLIHDSDGKWLVLQQTGPFTNASFTGANVLEMTGYTPLQVGYLPEFTLGLFTSSGNGNVTASYDRVGASPIAPQTYTATYTVDATTGRTPITSGSRPRQSSIS